MRSVTLLSVLLFAGSAVAQQQQAATSDVGKTVDRGLGFLIKQSLAWKERGKCASCHHAGFILWSMREAKQKGYSVDPSVLAQITQWVAESGDGKVSVPRPANAPKALNETAVIFALALGADPKPDAGSLAGLKRFLQTVASDQFEGGFWSAWPETRQPILGQTDESVTALATLAVIRPAAAGDEAAKAIRDKGIRWLAQTKTSDDSQTIALRLIVWRQMNRPAGEWEPFVREIRRRQNADGGWSQTKEMASDAWATGQALYALTEAGIKPEDPAMARARSFLVKAQRSDGSWPMTSRPTKPGNAGSKNLDPITCAGSAQAILGLVH